jgi:hypothetical protein
MSTERSETAARRRLRIPMECRYAAGAGTVLFLAGPASAATFVICAVGYEVMKAAVEWDMRRVKRGFERHYGVDLS